LQKYTIHKDEITFSGSYALKKQQNVLYITERCVFRLSNNGMELIEIAPGVDLERDILSNIDFKPVINCPIRLMDERIFRDEPMKMIDNF